MTPEGLAQPPAGAAGWWQASDGLWYPPEGQTLPPSAPQGAGPQRMSNGMATAALVLGIIGVVCGIIPLLFFVSLPLGVLGLVLGILGRRKATKSNISGKGTALAGAILGAIALVLGIIGVVVVVNAVDEVDNIFDELGGEADPDHYEVTIDCGEDDLGDVLPSGEITNTSDEVRGFQIEIEILDGDVRLDGTSTFVEDLDPGQTSEWEAFSTADTGPGVTCDITSVNNWGVGE